jgi:hypothetical protein
LLASANQSSKAIRKPQGVGSVVQEATPSTVQQQGTAVDGPAKGVDMPAQGDALLAAKSIAAEDVEDNAQTKIVHESSASDAFTQPNTFLSARTESFGDQPVVDRKKALASARTGSFDNVAAVTQPNTFLSAMTESFCDQAVVEQKQKEALASARTESFDNIAAVPQPTALLSARTEPIDDQAAVDRNKALASARTDSFDKVAAIAQPNMLVSARTNSLGEQSVVDRNRALASARTDSFENIAAVAWPNTLFSARTESTKLSTHEDRNGAPEQVAKSEAAGMMDRSARTESFGNVPEKTSSPEETNMRGSAPIVSAENSSAQEDPTSLKEEARADRLPEIHRQPVIVFEGALKSGGFWCCD